MRVKKKTTIFIVFISKNLFDILYLRNKDYI
jgi:hypothetical protein